MHGGFLDKQSGHIELPQYDTVYDYYCKDADSPILVKKDGLYGYLHRYDGTVAIPFQYNGECSYSEFCNGYAVAVHALITDTYYIPNNSLIDQNGREVLFPEGLMPVTNVSDERVIVLDVTDRENFTGKYGVATCKGEIIL